MAGARRWGFSIPLFGITLAEHRQVMEEAEGLGYTDAWSLEVDGTDAFTPLALLRRGPSACAWARPSPARSPAAPPPWR